MSDDYQYRILEAIEANGERLDTIIDLLREIVALADRVEYIDGEEYLSTGDEAVENGGKE